MNSQQLREVTVQKLHASKEICVQIVQLILYSVIPVMMVTHWSSFPKMMKLVTVLILILFIMTYLVSRRVVGNVMMKKLCV